MRYHALVAALCLTIPAQLLRAQGPPPARVYVDAATIETVDTYREVTGALRPAQRSLVACRETGVVETFDVFVGDTVESGATLATLVDDILSLQVEQAEAQVESDRGLVEERKNDLARAERDLARLTAMAERGSAKPVELDDARTDTAKFTAQLAQAEADLAANSAALDVAKRRLYNATIRAPFTGRVVAKHTEVGQWLPAGGDVVELLALRTLECWLNVPESAVTALAAHDAPVRVRIDALGRSVEAPVAAIVPDADPLSRLFPVRLMIDNPDAALSPGMSVTGLIPTGVAGQAMTIAGDAVRVDELGEFVFVDRGGTAAVVRVRTVYTIGDRAVIRDGALQEGDRLVVEGNERLFPGQPLTIMNDQPRGDG